MLRISGRAPLEQPEGRRRRRESSPATAWGAPHCQGCGHSACQATAGRGGRWRPVQEGRIRGEGGEEGGLVCSGDGDSE